MIQIAALLAGWPARLGILATAVAALVGLRAWDKSHQRAIGRTEIVEASKKEGAKANAKNDEVRRAAAQPGAAARLLNDKSSCRDC